MKPLLPAFRHALLTMPLAATLALFLYGTLALPPLAAVSLLLTLFPYLLIGSALFYLVHFLVRRTGLAAFMLILAVGLCAFRHADLLAPSDAGVVLQGEPVTVMTWNVQRMGLFENQDHVRANLARAVTTIRQERPDLLVLQEICRRQMHVLMEQMNVAAGSCDWTDYHGRGDPGLGGLAVCILNDEQWTILQKKKLDLPPSWRYLFVELQNSRMQRINLLGIHVAPPRMTEERLKGIVVMALKLQGTAFTEARALFREYQSQVHIQEDQIKKVVDLIKRFHDPTIIAGDFNSPPDLPLHSTLRGHLNDAWKAGGSGMGHTRVWGGFLPLRIDYIYASRAFVVTSSRTMDAGFSDHKPLVATMRLRQDAAGRPGG